MKPNTFLLWCPRILALVVTAYAGLFALDAFEPGKPFIQALGDFARHLVPAGIVLGMLALAWRWPWIGGVAFVLLAAGYAVMVGFRLDWVVAISGPLLIVGVLFLWSWWNQRHVPAM